MRETEAEIRELQALLDRSYERAGDHLRSIIDPERRLDARQVVRYLDGVKHIALATTTADGRPRVGPVDALFLHGRFQGGTAGNSLRMRHMRRRRDVSATHFVGDEIAITVHGRAVLMGEGDPDVAELEELWIEHYGMAPWGLADEVVMFRIEPESMFTFATSPADHPT